MEEMLKDLNRVLKSFHPLGDDALLGFVIITFGDGDVFTVAPGNIAARLTELGYVKMSDDHPCEGCKHKEFIRVRDDDRNFQDLLKDDLYVKAADLESLGYVKIVLCRDCWKWGKDDCPVGDSWDDDDFCCYGEAKGARE